QDKEIANEQAKQLREKQTYVLDQRMAIEEREIENEKALERLRTERDIAFTAEAKRREIVQVQKELALEQERRDREIALIVLSEQQRLLLANFFLRDLPTALEHEAVANQEKEISDERARDRTRRQ